jgi:hypothetical protein
MKYGVEDLGYLYGKGLVREKAEDLELPNHLPLRWNR